MHSAVDVLWGFAICADKRAGVSHRNRPIITLAPVSAEVKPQSLRPLLVGNDLAEHTARIFERGLEALSATA